MCALAGPLLTDLDFLASEFEKTDEPLFEGTQGNYQAWVRSSWLLCILAFCLVMTTQCQIISFVFLSYYFLSLVSRQFYCIDVCLVCENETSDYFLYMCARIWLLYYNLRYSRKSFLSLWISASHCHVPVFHILESGAWQFTLENFSPQKETYNLHFYLGMLVWIT